MLFKQLQKISIKEIFSIEKPLSSGFSMFVVNRKNQAEAKQNHLGIAVTTTRKMSFSLHQLKKLKSGGVSFLTKYLDK